jgi:hypothetical protein
VPPYCYPGPWWLPELSPGRANAGSYHLR